MPSADLTSSPEDFLTQTYDYLIIGGGTAGLVVASRLSANPDVRLLELSGIGEPEHLASLGVPCRVPLPGVGTNLQEHPVSAVVYELADGVLSIEAILRDESLLKQHLQLLQEQHSGAFSGPVSLMGFIPYWPQVSAERLNETIVCVLQPHSDNATDDPDLVTFQHR
ncbi:hypothetical protein CBS147323_8112 [Aspergillus niger]|nr:hypothetical protein CBS147323_8112 [Aspergillus niger]